MPTEAPKNFAAIPTSSKQVQFSWTSPSEYDTNTIDNYTLKCAAEVLGDNPVVMTYVEAGSYTLGGLRPATQYNCSVFASNSIGNGPSASINVTTLDESKTQAIQPVKL